MILNKIEDRRDSLDKARRRELHDFAVANGVKEITSDTPAILARHILRQRGLTRIVTPPRPLGARNQPGTGLKYQNHMQTPGGQQPPQGVEADMIADLARQFATQARPPAVDPSGDKPLAKWSINELGAEMKRLNIHRDRRDNMKTMREKIEAHRGQNAP
jgi:hypothetical protein